MIDLNKKNKLQLILEKSRNPYEDDLDDKESQIILEPNKEGFFGEDEEDEESDEDDIKLQIENIVNRVESILRRIIYNNTSLVKNNEQKSNSLDILNKQLDEQVAEYLKTLKNTTIDKHTIVKKIAKLQSLIKKTYKNEYDKKIQQLKIELKKADSNTAQTVKKLIDIAKKDKQKYDNFKIHINRSPKPVKKVSTPPTSKQDTAEKIKELRDKINSLEKQKDKVSASKQSPISIGKRIRQIDNEIEQIYNAIKNLDNTPRVQAAQESRPIQTPQKKKKQTPYIEQQISGDYSSKTHFSKTIQAHIRSLGNEFTKLMEELPPPVEAPEKSDLDTVQKNTSISLDTELNKVKNQNISPELLIARNAQTILARKLSKGSRDTLSKEGPITTKAGQDRLIEKIKIYSNPPVVDIKYQTAPGSDIKIVLNKIGSDKNSKTEAELIDIIYRDANEEVLNEIQKLEDGKVPVKKQFTVIDYDGTPVDFICNFVLQPKSLTDHLLDEYRKLLDILCTKIIVSMIYKCKALIGFSHSNLEMDDIFSMCFLALYNKWIYSYDEDAGAKFTTYVAFSTINLCRAELKIPSHQEGGKKVQTTFQPLDAPMGEDGLTLAQLLADPNSKNTEEAMFIEQRNQAVRQSLSKNVLKYVTSVLDIPTFDSNAKNTNTNKLTRNEVTKTEDKIKRLSDSLSNLNKRATTIQDRLADIAQNPDKYTKYNKEKLNTKITQIKTQHSDILSLIPQIKKSIKLHKEKIKNAEIVEEVKPQEEPTQKKTYVPVDKFKLNFQWIDAVRILVSSSLFKNQNIDDLIDIQDQPKSLQVLINTILAFSGYDNMEQLLVDVLRANNYRPMSQKQAIAIRDDMLAKSIEKYNNQRKKKKIVSREMPSYIVPADEEDIEDDEDTKPDEQNPEYMNLEISDEAFFSYKLPSDKKTKSQQDSKEKDDNKQSIIALRKTYTSKGNDLVYDEFNFKQLYQFASKFNIRLAKKIKLIHQFNTSEKIFKRMQLLMNSNKTLQDGDKFIIYKMKESITNTILKLQQYARENDINDFQYNGEISTKTYHDYISWAVRRLHNNHDLQKVADELSTNEPLINMVKLTTLPGQKEEFPYIKITLEDLYNFQMKYAKQLFDEIIYSKEYLNASDEIKSKINKQFKNMYKYVPYQTIERGAYLLLDVDSKTGQPKKKSTKPEKNTVDSKYASFNFAYSTQLATQLSKQFDLPSVFGQDKSVVGSKHKVAVGSINKYIGTLKLVKVSNFEFTKKIITDEDGKKSVDVVEDTLDSFKLRKLMSNARVSENLNQIEQFLQLNNLRQQLKLAQKLSVIFDAEKLNNYKSEYLDDEHYKRRKKDDEYTDLAIQEQLKAQIKPYIKSLQIFKFKDTLDRLLQEVLDADDNDNIKGISILIDEFKKCVDLIRSSYINFYQSKAEDSIKQQLSKIYKQAEQIWNTGDDIYQISLKLEDMTKKVLKMLNFPNLSQTQEKQQNIYSNPIKTEKIEDLISSVINANIKNERVYKSIVSDMIGQFLSAVKNMHELVQTHVKDMLNNEEFIKQHESLILEFVNDNFKSVIDGTIYDKVIEMLTKKIKEITYGNSEQLSSAVISSQFKKIFKKSFTGKLTESIDGYWQEEIYTFLMRRLVARFKVKSKTFFDRVENIDQKSAFSKVRPALNVIIEILDNKYLKQPDKTPIYKFISKHLEELDINIKTLINNVQSSTESLSHLDEVVDQLMKVIIYRIIKNESLQKKQIYNLSVEVQKSVGDNIDLISKSILATFDNILNEKIDNIFKSSKQLNQIISNSASQNKILDTYQKEHQSIIEENVKQILQPKIRKILKSNFNGFVKHVIKEVKQIQLNLKKVFEWQQSIIDLKAKESSASLREQALIRITRIYNEFSYNGSKHPRSDDQHNGYIEPEDFEEYKTRIEKSSSLYQLNLVISNFCAKLEDWAYDHLYAIISDKYLNKKMKFYKYSIESSPRWTYKFVRLSDFIKQPPKIEISKLSDDPTEEEIKKRKQEIDKAKTTVDGVRKKNIRRVKQFLNKNNLPVPRLLNTKTSSEK